MPSGKEYIRPKEKNWLVSGFPTNPSSNPPTNFFFNFQKKIQKKREENGEKVIKIRGTVQKLQALLEIAGNFSR